MSWRSPQGRILRADSDSEVTRRLAQTRGFKARHQPSGPEQLSQQQHQHEQDSSDDDVFLSSDESSDSEDYDAVVGAEARPLHLSAGGQLVQAVPHPMQLPPGGWHRSGGARGPPVVAVGQQVFSMPPQRQMAWQSPPLLQVRKQQEQQQPPPQMHQMHQIQQMQPPPPLLHHFSDGGDFGDGSGYSVWSDPFAAAVDEPRAGVSFHPAVVPALPASATSPQLLTSGPESATTDAVRPGVEQVVDPSQPPDNQWAQVGVADGPAQPPPTEHQPSQSTKALRAPPLVAPSTPLQQPAVSTPRSQLGAATGLDSEPGASGGNSKRVSFQPGDWEPDSEASHCKGCTKRFTFLMRKHHCRNCGHVFCDNCTRYRVPVLRKNYHRPVRVCGQCVDLLGKKQGHQSSANLQLRGQITALEDVSRALMNENQQLLKFAASLEAVDKQQARVISALHRQHALDQQTIVQLRTQMEAQERFWRQMLFEMTATSKASPPSALSVPVQQDSFPSFGGAMPLHLTPMHANQQPRQFPPPPSTRSLRHSARQLHVDPPQDAGASDLSFGNSPRHATGLPPGPSLMQPAYQLASPPPHLFGAEQPPPTPLHRPPDSGPAQQPGHDQLYQQHLHQRPFHLQQQQQPSQPWMTQPLPQAVGFEARLQHSSSSQSSPSLIEEHQLGAAATVAAAAATTVQSMLSTQSSASLWPGDTLGGSDMDSQVSSIRSADSGFGQSSQTPHHHQQLSSYSEPELAESVANDLRQLSQPSPHITADAPAAEPAVDHEPHEHFILSADQLRP